MSTHLNYIRAEIFRVLSKRSLYLFLAAVFAAYGVMMVVQYGGGAPGGAGNIVTQSKTLFSLMAILGGCYLFFTIYTDDLTAKTLPALIGFGKKRAGIVLSKLAIMTIFTAALFAATLLAFSGLFAAMGYDVGGDVAAGLWRVAAEKILMVAAFAAVSGTVVYGTQKMSLSVVTFAFLSSGIVSQLLINALDSQIVSGMFGRGLGSYTAIPIITRLTEGVSAATVLPYVIYIALFAGLSIVAFERKELEF